MTFIATALAFAKRLPWQVYAAIGVVLLLGLTYRAGWNARDEKADRERAEYIAQYEQAADRSRRAQQAVIDREQARYDALAERIDDEAEQTRVAVADATAAYIARNRVQDRQCSPSGTSAPASGDGAPIPAPVPTGIVVAEADVRACADLYAYSVSAREWALEIGNPD